MNIQQMSYKTDSQSNQNDENL